MEAGDVLVGIAQAELTQDVVANRFCRARGEGRDGVIREKFPQSPELPVFRAKFMSPFRNAVRFVDGEKRQRHAREKLDEILAQQPFRGQV